MTTMTEQKYDLPKKGTVRLNYESKSMSQLAIRLQQLPYSSSISFNFSDFIRSDALLSVQEVTIDLNTDKATADATRLVWLTQSDIISTSTINERDSESDISFDSEYVRSYILQLNSSSE